MLINPSNKRGALNLFGHVYTKSPFCMLLTVNAEGGMTVFAGKLSAFTLRALCRAVIL